MSTSIPGRADEFPQYAKDALDFTIKSEAEGTDNGDLELMHRLCRSSPKEKWAALTPEIFLESYVWCVGSVQKKIDDHEAFFPKQKELFRQFDAAKITRDSEAIWEEWESDKR